MWKITKVLVSLYGYMYNVVVFRICRRSAVFAFTYDVVYRYASEIMRKKPFTNLGYEYTNHQAKVGIDKKIDSVSNNVLKVIPKAFTAQKSEIKLYSAVLSQVEVVGDTINGKRVMEVGCGRGGGSMTLLSEWKPSFFLGVDVSENGIKNCYRLHQDIKFELEKNPTDANKRAFEVSPVFTQGDAMDLSGTIGNLLCEDPNDIPNDYKFDIVYNVESSHCYPSFEKFITEVVKVMKPGGLFVWADLRGPFDPSSMEDEIRIIGTYFKILCHFDITENVKAALPEYCNTWNECYNEMIGNRSYPRFVGYMAQACKFGTVSSISRHFSSNMAEYRMVCSRYVPSP